MHRAGGNDSTDYLTFTAEQANATVALNKTRDSASLSAVLEYSTDGTTWTNYEWSGTTGTVITLVNVGDHVMFRGDNATFSINGNAHYNFATNGSLKLSGNINTLLAKNGNADLSNGCFYNLFTGCRGISSAAELKLPATILKEYCYYAMFAGCWALASAPELPATTLASRCYYQMFSNCPITKAPELPATILATSCYYSMFENCRGLTVAPELPATTLAQYCYYNMFNGCNALTSVKINFTNWNDTLNATKYWLTNVAASGTFYCQYGIDTSIRDASHIPAGWNVVYTSVPEEVVNQAAAVENLIMNND